MADDPGISRRRLLSAGSVAAAGTWPGTTAATTTLVGCSGVVDYENGFEGPEIAGSGGGIKFGSGGQSRNLPRLGEYRLWIDGGGHLRLKRGMPTSDRDGAVVGS